MNEKANNIQGLVHMAILELTRKFADAQNELDVSSDMTTDDVIKALEVSRKHVIEILQQHIRILNLAEWWQKELDAGKNDFIPIGLRHDALIKYGIAVLSNHSVKQARRLLFERNKCCVPPLPKKEVNRIWDWCMKKTCPKEA